MSPPLGAIASIKAAKRPFLRVFKKYDTLWLVIKWVHQYNANVITENIVFLNIKQFVDMIQSSVVCSKVLLRQQKVAQRSGIEGKS